MPTQNRISNSFKLLLVFSLCWLSGRAYAVAVDSIPWVLDGTSSWSSTGYVELVPNSGTSAGAMWDPCTINVNDGFNLTWTVFLGQQNYTCGGDGMAFVLQGDGTGVVGQDSGEHGYDNGG